MLRPDTPGEVVIEMPMWDACDGYLDAPPELARRFHNGVLCPATRARSIATASSCSGGRPR